MYRFSSCLLLFAFFSITATAQSKQDSIALVLHNGNATAAQKGAAYYAQGEWLTPQKKWQQTRNSFDSAAYFFALAKDPMMQCKSQLQAGFAAFSLLDADGTQRHTRQAYQLYKKYRLNDPGLFSKICLNLGNALRMKGSYTEGLQMLNEAITSMEKTGVSNMLGRVYTNMGVIYYQMENFAAAAQAYKKALDFFEAHGDAANAATVTSYMGLTLMEMNFDSSRAFYDRALELARKNEVWENVATYTKFLGQGYYSKGEPITALGYMKESLHLTLDSLQPNTSGDSLDVAMLRAHISSILSQLPQRQLDSLHIPQSRQQLYDSAIIAQQYMLQIGQQRKLPDIERTAWKELTNLHQLQGNYPAALDEYKKFIVMRDSLLNIEKQNEFNRKDMQFAFDKKEDSLRFTHRLTLQSLEKEQLLAEGRKKDLTAANKQNELQRLSFLQAQVLHQKEKEVQVAAVEKQQLQTRHAAEIKDRVIHQQKAELGYSKKLLFFSIIIALLVAIAAVIFFVNQRRTARLNRMVEEQKNELEYLNQVKDKLFTVVSHDLKTPVTSLISFIYLLESGSLTIENLLEHSKVLKKDIGYTSAMMSNLLSWAGSQMQGFKPDVQPIDLHAVATEVMGGLQASARDKKITISNQLPAGSIAMADYNMAALILRNLVSNAIKFTPEGGTIELGRSPSGHSGFYVKDSGMGMDAALVAKFNNSSSNQLMESELGTGNEKGTGLGLFLCKSFAGIMYGDMRVESRPGHGTVFYVGLPGEG